jgi:hypothetical protein
MTTALPSSSLSFPVVAGFCLALGLTGCATPRVDWAARVGRYTYEQAVKDMGAPEQRDKLADGTVVAEWLTDRGYTYTHSSPSAEGPFYPSYPTTYTAPSQFVRLTFGPDGRLTTRKKLYQ